jgi:hypothetical protein
MNAWLTAAPPELNDIRPRISGYSPYSLYKNTNQSQLSGITGGVMISLWGGARHKTRTYLISALFSFLICDFLMAIRSLDTEVRPDWGPVPEVE